MRLTAIAGVRAAKKARERQMKETQRKEDHVATKTRDLGGLVSNLLLEKKRPYFCDFDYKKQDEAHEPECSHVC